MSSDTVERTASAPALIEEGMKKPILTKDQLELQAQGHIEEMPRQFTLLAAVGLAFSITNSWVAISATFQQPLTAGGGPGTVFALLVASIACFLITAGLAELASAFPTSGGQYHFTFMLATPGTKAFAAFVTGWLSVIAWILCTAASAIYAAQMVAYLVAYYKPNFEPQQYQIWLIYAGIVLLCFFVLTVFPSFLAPLEQMFFFCSIIAFLVFFITILATSPTKNPPKAVFVDFNNQCGWSDGVAFLLACGTAMYTFIGTDSVVHIAEEIPSPTLKVPRTMCLTMVIGIATSMPWCIALLFSGGDLESLRNSSQPIQTMFLAATRSHGASTFFTCWFLFIYFGATLSCLAATGRQAWAFSRDGGLPFSQWNSYISPNRQMPANATLFCSLVIIVYGLIYVGSTLAFNSFVNASILVMNVSYVVPQAISLYRGRDKVLPERAFDLGAFGPYINGFSIIWVTVFAVLFCFPVTSPTTVQSMNYVSVVVVGVVVVILGGWYGGKRRTFTGPKALVLLGGDEDSRIIVGQDLHLNSVEAPKK
ncbi:hypothetical protein VTK73DRAFT_1085 [Phialemonium thermophilum]|uniref:Amino acid transporter n=1 Tax=Phialemonium thermophilum TaxID=223376 RepID=A0ABR3XBX4_9PEZI